MSSKRATLGPAWGASSDPAAPAYNYTFDAMGHVSQMTGLLPGTSTTGTLASAGYGIAGEMRDFVESFEAVFLARVLKNRRLVFEVTKFQCGPAGPSPCVV